MKIKTIIIVLGILLPVLSIRAQDIKPLSIGDTVPDLVLHNVINYKDSVIRLSDLRGKLVILDFWATWCTNCIPAIQKLGDLSLARKDQIVIIAVSNERKLDVARFLDKRKELKDIHVLYVTEDMVLSKMFRYRLLPHEVIISPRQQVRSITDIDYITDSSMDSLLTNDNYNLPTKYDRLDIPKVASLLDIKDRNGEHATLYKKIFRLYMEGLGSHDAFADSGGFYHLEYQNMSLAAMYKDLLWKLYRVTDIQFQFKDERLRQEVFNGIEDKKHYYYCYAIERVNNIERSALYSEVLQDLDTAFHCKTRISPEEPKTAIITQTTNLP